MILTRIHLHNVFCYRNATLVLPRPTDERPITVIRGRNNRGKTSLLNALRLLLGAPTPEMLRHAAGSTGRGLSESQYILGRDGWLGVLNKPARQDPRSEYYIEAELEADRQKVRLRRSWTTAGTTTLEGEVNGKHQDESTLAAWLEERIPTPVLPYLLYDGEQVQRMASATATETAEAMIRLFNLLPLRTLRTVVHDLSLDWAKEFAPARKVNEEIAALKLELQQHELQIRIQEGELDELRQRQRQVQIELQQTQDAIRSLSGSGTADQRKDLDARLDQSRKAANDLQEKIATTGFAWLPLTAAPELVRRTLNKLDELEQSRPEKYTAKLELLRELESALPEQVVRNPPHDVTLTEHDTKWVKNRVRERLREYIRDLTPTQATWSLEDRSLRAVRSQLERSSAHTIAEPLVRLRGLRREVDTLAKQLREFEELNARDVRELDRLRAQVDSLNQQVGKLQEEEGQRISALGGARTSKTNAESRLSTKEGELFAAASRDRRVARGQHLEGFLRSFEQAMVDHRTARLSERLTARFRELFSSNNLVHGLRLTGDMKLRALTRDEEEVRLESLSAGTRQLIAMSLLWALLAEAGQATLSVVDTPLARLDLEHQERVLTRFLPRCARQVLLLPTNSELDPTKEALLAPHVNELWEIVNNDDGQNARFEPRANP